MIITVNTIYTIGKPAVAAEVMMRGRQRHPEKIAVIKVNIKRSCHAHTTPDNVPGILYATGPQQSPLSSLLCRPFAGSQLQSEG